MKTKRKKLFTEALRCRAVRLNKSRRQRAFHGIEDDCFIRETMNDEAYLDIPTYLRRGIDLGLFDKSACSESKMLHG